MEVLLPSRATAPEGINSAVIADPFEIDLQILLLIGGQERTTDEYADLLRDAGYAIRETFTLASVRGVSVLEALPAGR